MKKSLLFSLAILFFLFIKIQPVSAYVSGPTTCCPLGAIIGAASCFQVAGTCSTNADCGSDEYCDYSGAWCLGFGGPCKPLDCANCQVAQNHQCISGTAPSGSPDCCGYSCVEGGSSGGYSALLYDQTCYAYTNKLTDVNNCGSCGNKCDSKQTCENGKCITKTSCTPCDSGVTDCGVCSSATPGYKCIDDGSHIGKLVADSTCSSPCAASSSYTSQPACSGAVSGTGASCGYYWCSTSNSCVQSAADCAPPLTTSCSAYNSDAGNCNSAGGCYYCAIYGTCLSTTDTSCPGYVDCSSYTSQSACTTDGGSSGSPKPACGWCPNSYNSGTSANGGTCYAASVLASKCDSCFITGTYNTWTSGYCRDACPYAAPANGYVSGWCTMSNIMSGGTVNCAGNKFDVTKNNNGAVDCGECAINANNKDCGGTAVTNNVYSDTFLGYIYYNGVLSPGTVYYAKKTGTSLDSGVCPVSTASQPFGTLDACKTYYSGTNFVNETSPGFYGGVVCGSSYEGQTLSCYKRTGGYEGQYNPAECSNGIDNNRDCLIDCADPNCDFSLKFLDELFKPAA